MNKQTIKRRKQIKNLGGYKMKSIKFFIACIFALTFVACSNAESDSFEDYTSNFESIKSMYGIQSAAYDSKVGDAPSVTTEEMTSVLEALRQNGNTVRECTNENQEGYYGEDSDKKSVLMTAEYQARTRSGAFLEQFALCVSLNFNVDKGTVYYIGATYSSSTDLFSWQGYGTSLSTTADGGSKFKSTTYLYFRVSDQNDCLVKVPVNFEGSYNFGQGRGTYSFTLSAAK